MSEAVRAAEWLLENYTVLHWFNGGWKVRKRMGFCLGESVTLASDAELISFAREKGWEG